MLMLHSIPAVPALALAIALFLVCFSFPLPAQGQSLNCDSHVNELFESRVKSRLDLNGTDQTQICGSDCTSLGDSSFTELGYSNPYFSSYPMASHKYQLSTINPAGEPWFALEIVNDISANNHTLSKYSISMTIRLNTNCPPHSLLGSSIQWTIPNIQPQTYLAWKFRIPSSYFVPSTNQESQSATLRYSSLVVEFTETEYGNPGTLSTTTYDLTSASGADLQYNLFQTFFYEWEGFQSADDRQHPVFLPQILPISVSPAVNADADAVDQYVYSLPADTMPVFGGDYCSANYDHSTDPANPSKLQTVLSLDCPFSYSAAPGYYLGFSTVYFDFYRFYMSYNYPFSIKPVAASAMTQQIVNPQIVQPPQSLLSHAASQGSAIPADRLFLWLQYVSVSWYQTAHPSYDPSVPLALTVNTLSLTHLPVNWTIDEAIQFNYTIQSVQTKQSLLSGILQPIPSPYRPYYVTTIQLPPLLSNLSHHVSMGELLEFQFTAYDRIESRFYPLIGAPLFISGRTMPKQLTFCYERCPYDESSDNAQRNRILFIVVPICSVLILAIIVKVLWDRKRRQAQLNDEYRSLDLSLNSVNPNSINAPSEYRYESHV